MALGVIESRVGMHLVASPSKIADVYAAAWLKSLRRHGRVKEATPLFETDPILFGEKRPEPAYLTANFLPFNQIWTKLTEILLEAALGLMGGDEWSSLEPNNPNSALDLRDLCDDASASEQTCHRRQATGRWPWTDWCPCQDQPSHDLHFQTGRE
ncbi:uncharacterized protein LOC132195431 [Neocloeon triangulifer]|uniref:uncharacterized protein LOC132195431 n=1 Tax=Neocloeon triangulifer TaxID=2078957 RepID=UPI00286FAC72|nr:uncharacterized protein LOC132195431 [Neocloeon triangulifer]XP_059473395.1 uncharacterized protein LOC132195431 [Neocloeon triangulifer]